MNQHSRALFVMGLKNRLHKLRSEAIELANAIDRLEEGKGTFDDVLHEMRDVEFVWRSVEYSQQCFDAVERDPWIKHEAAAQNKLDAAIAEMERFTEGFIKDGEK